MAKEIFYCIPQDCECPYYSNGWCGLDNPQEECDDYASLCESEDEDE